MIVLVGKTCSGKSTVADILEEQYDIRRVRTYTTRPCREGETNEYHFISDEEFEKLKAEGFFFETTQYTVANGDIWHYGTAKSDLCDECCIVMNPDGVKKSKRLLDEKYLVNVIYLNVSEGIQWNRLRERGQDADESARRIEADKVDFANIESYYDLAITTDYLMPKVVADMISFIVNEYF